MTAMTVAGLPLMTIDSCAWSAKGVPPIHRCPDLVVRQLAYGYRPTPGATGPVSGEAIRPASGGRGLYIGSRGPVLRLSLSRGARAAPAPGSRAGHPGR